MAAKRYKTALDFGEDARCVPSGELLAFNSCWNGVVQTFLRRKNVGMASSACLGFLWQGHHGLFPANWCKLVDSFRSSL